MLFNETIDNVSVNCINKSILKKYEKRVAHFLIVSSRGMGMGLVLIG
jgi:hypothetical protein